MTEDNERTFIQRELDVAKDMCGAEPSPEEFALQFSKMNMRDRSLKLDQIAADLVGRTFSIADAARHQAYENAARSVHNVLRKIRK